MGREEDMVVRTGVGMPSGEFTTGEFTYVEEEEAQAKTDRAKTIASRYEIASLIATGAMGQVLHVRHRRLGKSFALKLMQPDTATSPDAVRLFESEARLASSLSHRHIVSVVDFGEDPDWGLFITMELLQGQPLSARIAEQGKLTVKDACTIARQVASALQHSHEMGVVHGDVKSDNVFWLDDEEQGIHIKLLDFGMAELASQQRQKSGQIAGTPEYMAPERIVGNPPTPANDIYALGIVLYEMLNGTTPFVGGEPEEILRRHLSQAPGSIEPRPGEYIRPELQRIIDRALHKDLAQRYSSARELKEDLKEILFDLGFDDERSGIMEIPLEPMKRREDVAADAFDALGIAAAGIDANGVVVVANRAFAKLLGAKSVGAIEKRNVLATSLGRLHPGIREDLMTVAMKGKGVRRVLKTRSKRDKRARHIRLVMTPSKGKAGSCMLVLYPD